MVLILTDLVDNNSLAKAQRSPRIFMLLVMHGVSLRLGVLCEMDKHSNIH
jgi:hypothetical protein